MDEIWSRCKRVSYQTGRCCRTMQRALGPQLHGSRHARFTQISTSEQSPSPLQPSPHIKKLSMKPSYFGEREGKGRAVGYERERESMLPTRALSTNLGVGVGE